MSTETIERPRVGEPGEGTGGEWRVIGLNDDHNTFDGVAAALAAVLPECSFSLGLAYANRVHTMGSAVVWSGHREVAEHYCNGLKRRGLTMAPLET